MTQTPTKTQILLARLAVGLIVAFAVLGVAIYGFSAEVRQRIWQNLLDRPSGPMTFRFFLQPIMASIAAWRDGVKDARTRALALSLDDAHASGEGSAAACARG